MSYLQRYSADLLTMLLVLILGFHFIVVKDAIQHFTPITYNAIRFLIGAFVMLAVGWRIRHQLRFERRDLIYLFVAAMLGLVGYQVLFITSLSLTTSTNTSLMVMTMPTWTAIISMLTGRIVVRKGLFVGLLMVTFGVALVVLSGSSSGVGVSRNDVLGSAIGLGAAALLGGFVVLTSDLITKYGALPNSVFRHLFTTIGLTTIAAPDMLSLSVADFPIELLPHFLYSGLLASLAGFTISNYAIKKLGPARFTSYNNFIPVVTAIAGVVVLGDTLTTGLVLGGAMTISGVAMVRRFTTDIHEPRTAQIALPFRRRLTPISGRA